MVRETSIFDAYAIFDAAYYWENKATIILGRIAAIARCGLLLQTE